MNAMTLTALSLLLSPFLLSPAAHAGQKVLSEIRLDLDGDGKPDTVRVVDYGRQMNSLEVFLSASSRALSFDHLLGGSTYSQKNPPEMNYAPTLTIAGNASFEIHQFADGGYHYTGDLWVSVQFENGELKVIKSKAVGGHHGGDIDDGIDEEFDFVTGAASRSEFDRRTDAGNFSKQASWTVPDDCRPTLAAWNPQALPVCALLP